MHCRQLAIAKIFWKKLIRFWVNLRNGVVPIIGKWFLLSFFFNKYKCFSELSLSFNGKKCNWNTLKDHLNVWEVWEIASFALWCPFFILFIIFVLIYVVFYVYWFFFYYNEVYVIFLWFFWTNIYLSTEILSLQFLKSVYNN